jgi:hypothetical protein
MALTRDFARLESAVTATSTLSITAQLNEVSNTVWIDVTTEISSVVYTLARYVIPLSLANQIKVDDEWQQALQLGGVSVYKFDATATAYAAGTAPATSAGTLVAQIPATASTLMDLDAYLTGRGVARGA